MPGIEATFSKRALELIANLGATPALGAKLARTMDRQNLLTVQAVKNKLAGPVLNYQSGRLQSSIGATGAVQSVTGTGVQVVSTVGSGVGGGQQSVRYAAIHEYGGVILPVNAAALRFKVGGRWVFAKRVVMPERSYLRSTFRERVKDYSRMLSRTVIRHWRLQAEGVA